MSEFLSAATIDPDVLKVAEPSVRAMISALDEQKVPADVTVDAVLHVLAAWETSRQASFSVAERETCIQELVEMLLPHIDRERAASWLPNARGGDQ
jgi:hypothetical protein